MRRLIGGGGLAALQASLSELFHAHIVVSGGGRILVLDVEGSSAVGGRA